mmetsp:Transcript_27783/g.49669  ORF Transcript_27783/g.49669 Transcript_27783/m.49669 type:complete len:95 (-) Transcript_27783:745-1029(-)
MFHISLAVIELSRQKTGMVRYRVPQIPYHEVSELSRPSATHFLGSEPLGLTTEGTGAKPLVFQLLNLLIIAFIPGSQCRFTRGALIAQWRKHSC